MTDENVTKVRTTMRPDEEIEVGPAELLDLQRQNLIHEGEPEPPKADSPPSRRRPAPEGSDQ